MQGAESGPMAEDDPLNQPSHRNAAEACPDWAIPSRRWAWRLALAFCALVWGGLLFWLFGAAQAAL